MVASKCFFCSCFCAKAKCNICLELPSLPYCPYPIEFFFSVSQSLYWWTEYADLITKFSGIDRFEKEINCKNHERRSCMFSGLLKKAGMASRNVVTKRQYTLLWSALLWTFFFGSIGFNFLLRMGLHSARFAAEDADLNRRKSGKYKKYLCKLENTENSIFFSVKPNFKSDIQNIFNCLLHFYARQMDQRLGFYITE